MQADSLISGCFYRKYKREALKCVYPFYLVFAFNSHQTIRGKVRGLTKRNVLKYCITLLYQSKVFLHNQSLPHTRSCHATHTPTIATSCPYGQNEMWAMGRPYQWHYSFSHSKYRHQLTELYTRGNAVGIFKNVSVKNALNENTRRLGLHHCCQVKFKLHRNILHSCWK